MLSQTPLSHVRDLPVRKDLVWMTLTWMSLCALGLGACTTENFDCGAPGELKRITSDFDARTIEGCAVGQFSLIVTHPAALDNLKRLEGDLTIDLARLAVGQDVAFAFPALTDIQGTLTIKNYAPWPGEHALDLSALRHVGRGVIVENIPIEHLTLDIEAIGGPLRIIGNQRLAELSMPRLTRVGGEIEISGCASCPLAGSENGELDNVSLETVGLPALAHISKGMKVAFSLALETLDLSGIEESRGDVLMYGPSALTALRFPLLKDAERLTISGHDAMNPIVLSALETIEDLTIDELTDLRALQMNRLESIQGKLNIINNPALNTIEMPLPGIVGTLKLEGNHRVTALSLPELAYADTVDITNNLSLGSVDLKMLTTS